jgi:hypothetical protein
MTLQALETKQNWGASKAESGFYPLRSSSVLLEKTSTRSPAGKFLTFRSPPTASISLQKPELLNRRRRNDYIIPATSG